MPLKATAFPIRQPVLDFGSPAQPADTAPLVAIGEQSHTQRVHPESQTCSGTYSLRFRHPVDLGCTGAHDAWSSVWHLVGTSKFQESETWARISAATQGHRQSPTEEPDVGGFGIWISGRLPPTQRRRTAVHCAVVRGRAGLPSLQSGTSECRLW